MNEIIHFCNGDDRFCGSTTKGRRFTFDPNEVTCQPCKDNDRLHLTEQGAQFIRSLEEAPQ